MQFLLNSAIWVALIALIPVFAGKWLEKHSTNKAVMAEISRLLKVVELHRDFWQKCVADNSTDRRVLIPFTYRIYTNQIGNMGIIRSRIVAEVVEFYGDIDFVNAYQAMKDHALETGYLEEFNAAYIGFLSNILEQFAPAFGKEFKRLNIASHS